MKKTIFSLLLSLCLTFTALVFTVRADTTLRLSVSANGGDYTSVESALAAVETMAKEGKLNEKGVCLVLTGVHTATSNDGILFGQKTIFLPNGKKLPVTVTGGTLQLPVGEVACANDYIFSEITIPFDDVQTALYAGSGNVTLEKVTVDLNGTAEYKSSFFGDNFTAAVFDGWTEESLNLYKEEGLFVSAMTLGNGFVYKNTSGYPYAAVGSSTDFSAKIGNQTISADDTCAKLMIDGATLHNTMARVGSNPVGNSVLQLKSGSVSRLHAAGFDLQSHLSGDVTVLVEGGHCADFVRILNKLTLNGNLNVSLQNLDLTSNFEIENGCMIQILFGANTIRGNVNVSMDHVKGDRYFGGRGSSSITVTGDVSTVVKNSSFSQYYLGGVGKGTVYGNIENTLENVTMGYYKGADECAALGNADQYTGAKNSVGNVINNLKNVTFQSDTSVSTYLGNISGTQTGKIINNLDGVTVPSTVSFYCGNRGGAVEGIDNTIINSSFAANFCGGGSGGTVKGITNNYENVTFTNYCYLSGSANTVAGQIENRLTNCNVTKFYIFGGTNTGKVLNDDLEYGTRNYINGGSFHGFWGGSASSAAEHKGNIYTEVCGGDFHIYDSSRPYSFSGGNRNTLHEGNATTLIRGGTFHGYVAGGSIPNDENYQKEHLGATELILAGGTFQDTVDPNCRWGNYRSYHLILNNELALEPFSFAKDVECDAFIAASETATSLIEEIHCKDLIARGKGALQIYGKVTCDNFTVETNAPSPALYGSVRCVKLNLGGKELHLGARASLIADAVVGAVTLYQSEYWLNHTYFTSPADTEIDCYAAEESLGSVTVNQGVVTGSSLAFAGASFVFSDTVRIRFAFNKEAIDAAQDKFSFIVSCGTDILVSPASFEDLVLKDGYYTILSDTLSAAQLCEKIRCTGSLISPISFTLTELAANGIKIYDKEGQSKELASLLKAFSNYAVAADNYNNGKNTPLPYENLATATGFTSCDGFSPMISSPSVTLTYKQLIMDDGMRIRYYLQSSEMKKTMRDDSPVHDLYYFYNCQDVSECATKKWVSTSSQKGYWQITVEFPLYPSKSSEVIRFMVTDKENLHLALPVDTTAPYTSYVHEDYIDRLDTFAETLAATAGAEELGSALLYYLQAGADYYASQPDLSEFSYPETFSAGYAREDVSPYGFIVDLSSAKTGNAVLDPLYATCLALWDGEDLALFFSVDVRQCPEYLTDNSKQLLAKEFDIDPNKIFFNATHNHSSPNTTSYSRSDVKKWYNEIFFPKMVQAAKKAVLDLAPANLYSGTALSDPGTNFVRRYLRSDGSYTGIQNIVPVTNIIAYESEADKQLRSLRFDRGDKKDILFVNWQGHAAHAAVYEYAATADFVGFLRDGVEEDLDVHFIYCNGASGNLNFTPKVKADIDAKYFAAPYFEGVGKSLVGTVKKAVADEKAIQSGKIKVTYIPHEGVIRHDDAETIAKANQCQEAMNAYQKANGKEVSADWIRQNYGFQSSYEVSAIRTRANFGETKILPVWAFSFGDVGMAFGPYEMFDSNGMQIRDGSPFAVTMIGGYTNGTHGYIPSAYAAPHNGYEVYTSRYVFSTGDEVAEKLAQALTKMYEK